MKTNPYIPPSVLARSYVQDKPSESLERITYHDALVIAPIFYVRPFNIMLAVKRELRDRRHPHCTHVEHMRQWKAREIARQHESAARVWSIYSAMQRIPSNI